MDNDTDIGEDYTSKTKERLNFHPMSKGKGPHTDL